MGRPARFLWFPFVLCIIFAGHDVALATESAETWESIVSGARDLFALVGSPDAEWLPPKVAALAQATAFAWEPLLSLREDEPPSHWSLQITDTAESVSYLSVNELSRIEDTFRIVFVHDGTLPLRGIESLRSLGEDRFRLDARLDPVSGEVAHLTVERERPPAMIRLGMADPLAPLELQLPQQPRSPRRGPFPQLPTWRMRGSASRRIDAGFVSEHADAKSFERFQLLEPASASALAAVLGDLPLGSGEYATTSEARWDFDQLMRQLARSVAGDPRFRGRPEAWLIRQFNKHVDLLARRRGAAEGEDAQLTAAGWAALRVRESDGHRRMRAALDYVAPRGRSRVSRSWPGRRTVGLRLSGAGGGSLTVRTTHREPGGLGEMTRTSRSSVFHSEQGGLIFYTRQSWIRRQLRRE